MNSYLDLEILMANATQSVNATWQHCLTLFLVSSELTQGRLNTALSFLIKKVCKTHEIIFQIHPCFSPSFLFSTLDVSRCSHLGFLPLSQIPGRWRVTPFSAAVTRLTQLAHQLLSSTYSVKWTIGSGQISSWQVSTSKKWKWFAFVNPRTYSAKALKTRGL